MRFYFDRVVVIGRFDWDWRFIFVIVYLRSCWQEVFVLFFYRMVSIFMMWNMVFYIDGDLSRRIKRKLYSFLQLSFGSYIYYVQYILFVDSKLLSLVYGGDREGDL